MVDERGALAIYVARFEGTTEPGFVLLIPGLEEATRCEIELNAKLLLRDRGLDSDRRA